MEGVGTVSVGGLGNFCLGLVVLVGLERRGDRERGWGREGRERGRDGKVEKRKWTRGLVHLRRRIGKAWHGYYIGV